MNFRLKPKLLEAVKGIISGGDLDDRKMLVRISRRVVSSIFSDLLSIQFEHLIVNISRTPADSGASLSVQQFLISLRK